jgi:hypothetical protein
VGLLIKADADLFRPPVRQGGELPPQANHTSVPLKEAGVGLTRQLVPIEP